MRLREVAARDRQGAASDGRGIRSGYDASAFTPTGSRAASRRGANSEWEIMTLTDLRKIDELKQACSDVVKANQENEKHIQWGNDLRQFLAEIRAADIHTRASEEFQRKIWDDNPVVKFAPSCLESMTAFERLTCWMCRRTQTSWAVIRSRQCSMRSGISTAA